MAISPDDRVLLLAMADRSIQKYLLANLTGASLGLPVGEIRGVEPAVLLFAADSRTVYAVATDGYVYTIDVATMSQATPRIAYDPASLPADRAMRRRRTMAALSPDGQYIAINTSRNQLNVVDLAAGRSWLVDTPGLSATYGLAFNYRVPQPTLLAVHGWNAVAVYDFLPTRLILRASILLPKQVYPLDVPEVWHRFATLAWTGRGDAVIAAIGTLQEYRILDFQLGEPSRLGRRLDFDVCTASDQTHKGQEIDVLTLNDRLPRFTPTPTASPVRSPTGTPTLTPTVTYTATPLPSLSRSSSPTAIRTTATPTPKPQPLYLPLALREQCAPGKQHVDVVLVIDASTTMRDQRTAAGRTKLAAAIEAARSFVGMMSLPPDQVGVVIFNNDARLLQRLTTRPAEIEAALGRIPDLVRQQTRIDRGIEEAHTELASERRRATNRPVLILLTDGLANPVPASVAVENAARAKAAGITIFTIGLGQPCELDMEELTAMASKPVYFYWAPDGEDLLAIYRTIASEIPCPAEAFWGRR